MGGCVSSSTKDKRASEFITRRKSQFEQPQPRSYSSSSSLKRHPSSNADIILSSGQPAVLARPSTNHKTVSASPEKTLSASAEKHRKFSVSVPSCTKCGKSCPKLEEAKDSKGQIFHRTCLKCSTCGTSLASRECVPLNTPRMTSSQYTISNSEELCCDKHNPKNCFARKNSVKGQNISERAIKESELVEVGTSRRDLNKEAAKVLEDSSAGLTAEMTCSRCGFPVQKSEKLLVSGMQKFHEFCPTKQEQENLDKTVKYFLKKLPDRLALVLKMSERPFTFLFDLDRTSLKEALTKSSSAAKISFLPDSKQACKKDFQKTFFENLENIELQIKSYPVQFPSEPSTVSFKDNVLRVTTQTQVQGVAQVLEALFKYEENSLVSYSVFVSLETTNEDTTHNPLAALRLKRRDTSTSTASAVPPEPKLSSLSLRDADSSVWTREASSTNSSVMKKMSNLAPKTPPALPKNKPIIKVNEIDMDVC